jgi:hypothetical protein
MRRSLIVRTLLILTLLLGGSVIYSVLRPYPFSAHPMLVPISEAIPKSYFNLTMYNYRNATPWPSIQFASLRTMGLPVSWANIHQDRTTFIWSSLDALINLAESHGVELVYTLGQTPRWASASPDNATSPYGPGQCAPPAKMEYWDEFLRAIVTHTGGKIKFWENWNEPQSPDSVFYCGDITTMVELQRRAYEIIKSIDPSAKVLTPSPVGGYGPSWMSRFLAAGGGKYADIMAFHGYLALHDDAESILSTITKFKAVFAEHGQETKPVWDTEAGWGENISLSDPDLQASFLAKFYLLHWSAGVERFYWYAYDEANWGTLWDPKRGLHKAGIAYREVHQWLQGATMIAPCALDQALWTCTLVRDNGYRALVLWSAAKASVPATSVSVPNDFRQYRDLEGALQRVVDGKVPLSNKPILVETSAAF